MREKLYHICNKSSKIIFRIEDDYRMAINRLASCSYNTSTRVLAYSIMSTHFHLIVRTANLERFLRIYKLNLSVWHNHRYSAGIHIETSYRELLNEGEIHTAVNYVLKNPVHHNICESPFSYPYSSTYCYFPELYCFKEFKKKDTITPFELSKLEYRKLFGRQEVPKSLEIIDHREVLPSSFIDYKSIRYLYRSLQNFSFHLTKTYPSEFEMFPDEAMAVKESANRFSLFGKISDIQLCTMIDSRISPNTYTQISESERNQLWEWLKRQGVSSIQFNRAL